MPIRTGPGPSPIVRTDTLVGGPAREVGVQDSPTTGPVRPFVPTALLDGLDAPVRTGPFAPVGDGDPSWPGSITAAQLVAVMPALPLDKAQAYLPYLNAAMKAADISTPKRQAMFLAQLGHESGGLQWMEEFASGRAYEGRRDLGNTQRGDGERFKGRGPIQLTGRDNYTRAGRDLGLDLVNDPKQVATPEVGFRTAAWFWNDKGINAEADQMDLKGATRLINAGLRGLADRAAYYARAKQALGV